MSTHEDEAMAEPPTASLEMEPTASMNAAAQAFQLAIQQQTLPQETSTPSSTAAMADSTTNDTIMTDGTADQPASAIPQSLTNSTNGASPAPGRTGTPSRLLNGDSSSRAGSLHPDTASQRPTEPPLHGAPTRQYLNSKVVGPLLDGMKLLAREQPEDPLEVLAHYLLQRSRELKGTQ